MHPPSGTIDLGELPPGRPIELDAPWPARRRLRRWWRRSTWQVAGAAAATAFALVTAAGAAAPSQPAFVFQFAVQATGFESDAESLYTIDTSEPGETTITAYRLSDGAVRWTYSSSSIDSSSWLTNWYGALVLLSPAENNPVDYLYLERTTRLDPDTGRPLWTFDGSPVAVFGDLMLLAEPLDAQPPTDDQYTPPYLVTAVDLATGARQWSQEIPANGSYQVAEDEPGRLVTMSPDGRALTSYDLATGAVVARARLAPQARAELQVVGALAIVIDPSRSWTAYDVDTLAPRWTFNTDFDADSWPYECGRLLCLSGRVLRAIDPATGRLAWSADWAPADGDEWVEVFSSDSPALRGRLVLIHTDSTSEQHSWVVDAATGDALLDLGVWTFPVGGYAEFETSDPMPIWSQTRQFLGPEGPSGDRADEAATEGVVWFGRLRPDLSGVDPIGSVEVPLLNRYAYHQCGAQPSRVICAAEAIINPGGPSAWEVTVWRRR